MVAEVWNLVKSITIAWNKLKGISTKQEIQKEKDERETEEDEMLLADIRKIRFKIPGCSASSVEDVTE